MKEMILSEEEIALINEHRKKTAKKAWKPVDVDLILGTTKIAKFDELYGVACEIWKNGKDDDTEHWCYEEVMSLLDINRDFKYRH